MQPSSTSTDSSAEAPAEQETVVVSGIQPSGTLHIGNYFGALRQHIALHAQHEAYYFIVNYHALTTVKDAERLQQYTLDVALDYLALGFDPDKAVLFMQMQPSQLGGTSTGNGMSLGTGGTGFDDFAMLRQNCTFSLPTSQIGLTILSFIWAVDSIESNRTCND